MTTYFGSPEMCKAPRGIGWVDPPEVGGVTRRGESECLTQRGNVFPLRRPEYLHNIRTSRQRWWITHPAEAQALADDASVTVASLLCSGCRKLHARLVRSGEWP